MDDEEQHAEQIAQRIAHLRRQRGNIQRTLTMFKTTLETYAATPVAERVPERLQASLDGVKERSQPFVEIQEELESLDAEEVARRGPLEDMFDFVIGEAARYLTPITRALQQTNDHHVSRPATPNSTASLFSLLRLPELNIPKFDGSYEDYHPFMDAFKSSVAEHSDLSDSQKLQHLRGLLTGRALKAIESLSTTEQNYQTALDIIKKKYDHPRKIVRRHWQLLNDYPRLSKDTPEALGHLVDTFHQHTRALKNLQQPVDQWDLPLIYLIQSKISPETSYLWELKINDSKLPKYTSLLDFLENRSYCSSVNTTASGATTPSSRNDNSNRTRRGRQAFVTTNTSAPVTCVMCKENHHIMRCPKFKQLSTLDRFREAKKLALCINCLTPGHSVTKCNSRYCFECNKPHNTLLHRSETPTGEKSPTRAGTTPRDS